MNRSASPDLSSHQDALLARAVGIAQDALNLGGRRHGFAAHLQDHGSQAEALVGSKPGRVGSSRAESCLARPTPRRRMCRLQHSRRNREGSRSGTPCTATARLARRRERGDLAGVDRARPVSRIVAGGRSVTLAFAKAVTRVLAVEAALPGGLLRGDPAVNLLRLADVAICCRHALGLLPPRVAVCRIVRSAAAPAIAAGWAIGPSVRCWKENSHAAARARRREIVSIAA